MRKVLLTLALLGLVAGANAVPDDLTGGVLAAHFVPELVYSGDAPTGGWCAAYAPYAINDLAQVNARVDVVAGGDPNVWYVLAAWGLEDKTWCGTEFGLGDFDVVDGFSMAEGIPCFPSGGLEIPTAGWPGPNEGTAIVTTDIPWSGNYVPVYFFGGYTYGYATDIEITLDPPTAFVGFANCLAPPQTYMIEVDQLGILGVNMDGYVPEFPGVPEGACCVGEDCYFVPEAECITMGGEYLGNGVLCEPNPCLILDGACCVGGLCTVVEEAACALLGGEFLGAGTVCEPNPCPAVCCFIMPSGSHPCEILLQADCDAQGGFWHPEWISCDPNPCEEFTPTEDASWGSIKNLYR
jgi:hypothetical protein